MKAKGLQLINKDSAISRYGIWGAEHKIYNISASRFKLLRSEIFVDCRVLKVLIPNDSTFYFIDGGPCSSYRNAIMLLNCKKIKEISIIPPESSMKIWGLNVGRNGAIMINTEENP
jgi:hypothetical protein